ncbi:MAG: lysylphosphatidylglycerol synthase transmembrane domain-containing protein [Chloroflexota bacterium]
MRTSGPWKRIARYLGPLLGVTVFAYVLYLVLRAPISWEELGGLGAGTLLLLAGTQLLNDLLVPVQWRALHAPLGPVGLGTCARVILPNLHMNYFPLRGAIILVRMYAARREGIPLALSSTSLFLLFSWRWVVVLAMLPLLPLAIPGPGLKIAAVALALLAILAAGCLFRRRLLSVTALLGYWMQRSPRLKELGNGVVGMEERIGTILRSRGILIHTGLFLGMSLLTAVALSLVFRGVGVGIGPFAILLAWYASLFMGWLSHLPGGIGAQEASFAYLASLAGAPLEMAIAVAVLWRLVATVVDLMVSGGSFLAFRLHSSLQIKPAEEGTPSSMRFREGCGQ